MKKFSLPLLLLSLIFAYSCSTKKFDGPVVAPEAVLKNAMDFLVYRQKYLRLAEDYVAVDSAGERLNKSNFLQLLATGRYLPLKLKSKDSTVYYQLYNLDLEKDKEIGGIIGDWGAHLYSLNQMEGKPLPGFNVIDLDGKAYNDSTLKGKIAVLKFWFVHCVPCVKEMPALNELKAKYANRPDITFVSLVFDKKPSVDSFLQKTKFDYAVVADQKKYVLEDLKITQFPTHLIINKQGLVSYVGNTEKEMAVALAKEAAR